MHHDAALEKLTHDHVFAGARADESERRTWYVVALTAVTMVAEIVGGWWTGSMALLADGWHMGSHVAALGLAGFAYHFARTHADDRRFSMGTGKVGSLTAFGSALLLGVVALLMVWESGHRLLDPVAIDYRAAIIVTVIGLAVNVASAFLLGGHEHHHGHEYEHDGHDQDHHDHAHHAHHHDHNLRAAYVHVLTDALTSVLALVALGGGLWLGLAWLDPLMGIVGAVVILWWAAGLVRQSSRVLLDMRAARHGSQPGHCQADPPADRGGCRQSRGRSAPVAGRHRASRADRLARDALPASARALSRAARRDAAALALHVRDHPVRRCALRPCSGVTDPLFPRRHRC